MIKQNTSVVSVLIQKNCTCYYLSR